MELITDNLAQSLIVLGLVMLAIEIAILGFATFILFFVGVASVLAGALIYTGIIPDTLMSATLTVGILTAISAALLWKPLKSIQQQVDKKPAQSDLIGHRFLLEEDVSLNNNPYYHYSGIQWKLKSSQPISAGSMVKVTKAEVGLFYVEAVE
ncbi:NfeD family protein [Aliiglaciecola sp. 3_MG-2023]|uniref:NfeD family protein n=1 Tax=Aliiglaciecola sp. 3_MG-2023 TaxID=3062644 RepID=UPI0026E1F8CA|nr:NfeD family protein [Aliiglaciecola sp. 3_MG-2023]MDO6695737.1 NfeD family protein [Aliiglaciecola sp. 3_MG-2023]